MLVNEDIGDFLTEVREKIKTDRHNMGGDLNYYNPTTGKRTITTSTKIEQKDKQKCLERHGYYKNVKEINPKVK